MEEVQSQQPVEQENQVEGSYTCLLERFHQTNQVLGARLYSAAGYVLQSPTGLKYLIYSFAVCSEKDTFSKKKANLITEGRLRVGKFFVHPLTEEEATQSTSQVFLKYVRDLMPVEVLPSAAQVHAYKDVENMVYDLAIWANHETSNALFISQAEATKYLWAAEAEKVQKKNK